MLDPFDRKLLALLQEDAARSVGDLAALVGLSSTPCWRRIQRLEAEGLIRKRVALLDRQRLNVGITVFIAVRTSRHTAAWLEEFSRAVVDLPEIIDLYRLSGEIDYLMRAVVPDIAAFDALYKRLIQRIELSDVTSMFAMEEIKSTTAIPLGYA
jgi:Lrp/AsnC family transcriptional regulator